MLYFPPTVADRCDEMGWVLFPQDVQCFFESALLDQAVSSQVSTRGVSSDQVLFGEEALGSSVVARREMDLRKPECVFVVFCRLLVCAKGWEFEGTYGSKLAIYHL